MSDMSKQQKCLDFIDQVEAIARTRPGMLGSMNEIVAMFYISDNIKSLLLFGEMLPRELFWHEYLIERRLIRDLKPIPIEDGWDFERFAALRAQYLEWVKMRRTPEGRSQV